MKAEKLKDGYQLTLSKEEMETLNDCLFLAELRQTEKLLDTTNENGVNTNYIARNEGIRHKIIDFRSKIMLYLGI